jgi:hypothetical protein
MSIQHPRAQDFIQTTRPRLHLQEVLSLGFDRLRQHYGQRVSITCARSLTATLSLARGCAGRRRSILGSTRRGWGDIAFVTPSHADTRHEWVSQVPRHERPRIGTGQNLNVRTSANPLLKRAPTSMAGCHLIAQWISISAALACIRRPLQVAVDRAVACRS